MAQWKTSKCLVSQICAYTIVNLSWDHAADHKGCALLYS